MRLNKAVRVPYAATMIHTDPAGSCPIRNAKLKIQKGTLYRLHSLIVYTQYIFLELCVCARPRYRVLMCCLIFVVCVARLHHHIIRCPTISLRTPVKLHNKWKNALNSTAIIHLEDIPIACARASFSHAAHCSRLSVCAHINLYCWITAK